MQIGARAPIAHSTVTAAAPATSEATPPSQGAPRSLPKVKARVDKVTTFKSPDDYKIYAIRLASTAILAQNDLAKAQKDLVNGGATVADVNKAARDLNDVRAQIREAKDAVKGFKAFWWRFRFKFDAAEFWKSQGLDLSTMAVRPKAADLVATISGPTAEALKSALAAIDKNDWNQAQSAFKMASDVASTQKEALVAGQVSAGLRFDISADNAFRRAAELAKTSGEAVEVGAEAASFTNYKYRSADYAFRRGADLATSKEQALKVADRATSLGFAEAASYAIQRASQLS